MAKTWPSTPAGVAVTAYEYDADGRRVALKVPGGVTTTFVYDAFGKLMAEYGGVAAGTSGLLFFSQDHLGSTRLVTDAAGSPVRRLDYWPFGMEVFETDTAYRTAALGFGTGRDPVVRFTGKERDAETGLDYFGARYFSGAQGRFTSPDPSPLGIAMGDPQSWNFYAYTRNRPLSNIDVGGHWTQPVHQEIVRVSLAGFLSLGEIQTVIDSQAKVDSVFKQGQEFNHMHSMAVPGEPQATAYNRTWGFIADNIAIAGADATTNGVLSKAGLIALGTAIHTLQDSTSPMHVSDNGTLLPWRGLIGENVAGLAHKNGESYPYQAWNRFGQAIRLTLAAFLQASPLQARRAAGLTTETLDRVANKRISDYVQKYYNDTMPGRSEAEIEASRQCALGNPAACR